jgi:basic amino acid/polyamine antiporter, APA family
MQREADAGTVVLPGLAIPHVTVPGEGAFEMVIVRARGGGIQFPEREAVRAAFVLVSTADERAFHLRTLAAIAHAVQHDGFEERWQAAPDAEALRTLLLER